VLELADRTVETTSLIGQGMTGILKVGISAEGVLPLGNEILREFRSRHVNVDVRVFPGFGPTIIEGLTRRKLDAAIVLGPYAAEEAPFFLELGKVELLVALPKDHRAAALDRVPRSELMQDPFLDWPRSANPQLHAHLHDELFSGARHPQPVDVTEAPEVGRLLLVARGAGITVTTFPQELDLTNVVFRRLEDPVPLLDYGIAWFEPAVSDLVPELLEVARDIVQARQPG
jgi:DNA-binding transcriptional LysR family regulator